MCMSVPSSRGYAAPLGPRCHLLVLGTARLLSSPAHQTTGAEPLGSRVAYPR